MLFEMISHLLQIFSILHDPDYFCVIPIGFETVLHHFIRGHSPVFENTVFYQPFFLVLVLVRCMDMWGVVRGRTDMRGQ